MTQIVDLITSLERTEAGSRAEALTIYRETILRNNSPKPGDAAAMKKAMTTLRYTTDKLRGDLAALEAVANLERQAAAVDQAELDGQIETVSRELEEHRLASQQRKEQDREKSDDLFAKLRGLQHCGGQAAKAGSDAERMKRANWQLFGLPEPTPPAPERGVVCKML